MQSSENDRVIKANHRKTQSSTALSRKYTKRPARSMDVMSPVKRSPQIKRFDNKMTMNSPVNETEQIAPATPHPVQSAANAKMRSRMEQIQTMRSSSQTQAQKVTAKELKDRAIKKALASANNMDMAEESKLMTSKMKSKEEKGKQMHFGFGRIMLAMSCAAVIVFAIVYFVNMNMPDISLRVAAMQTGMDPSYPNYVPRDFNVASITSENGKITMEFKNSTNGDSFTLEEEKSSWDTSALLSNFVKEEYGENYSIIREQGLTIYISGSNATWVNGGILYKLKTTSGTLTNKQIRSIAVSL